MKSASAPALITAASIISPACSMTGPRSGKLLPVTLVYSIRTGPALTMV